MRRPLLLIATLFLIARLVLAWAYRDACHHFDMRYHQLAIADAAFHGHTLAYDKVLVAALARERDRAWRCVPVEQWDVFPRGGYSRFPAMDIPGYGYLIAWTSRLAGGGLTARYAHALQVLAELAALLAFLYGAGLAWGPAVAGTAGALYVLAYPFNWSLAALPLRDIFEMVTYGLAAGAYLLLARRPDGHRLALALALLALAAACLWIRPSTYYYFFLLAPLAWWLRGLHPGQRIALAVVTAALPVAIFGHPYRLYCLQHYGTTEHGFLGRRLFVGMAVPGNPYRLVPDGPPVTQWARDHGYDPGSQFSESFQPAINRALGAHAWQVVREHPGYYARVVLGRAAYILGHPLEIWPPVMTPNFDATGLGWRDYGARYPGALAFKAFNRIYGVIFFLAGLALAALMLARERGTRLELAICLSPLLYSLAIQLPLSFEQRYFCVAAWVLVVPLAWGLTRLRRPAA